MNIISIILSVGLCHWLLNYQFAFYGLKVIEYLGTQKKLNSLGQYVTHDPMCELFPTEVSETVLFNFCGTEKMYGVYLGKINRISTSCQ